MPSTEQLRVLYGDLSNNPELDRLVFWRDPIITDFELQSDSVDDASSITTFDANTVAQGEGDKDVSKQ